MNLQKAKLYMDAIEAGALLPEAKALKTVFGALALVSMGSVQLCTVGQGDQYYYIDEGTQTIAIYTLTFSGFYTYEISYFPKKLHK